MKTKKLTALAMLTALSLIIFIIEAQLPPLAPIPGIKLGLANIVTLITIYMYGRKEAFCVLALRIGLGAVFAGHMLSLIYSISGGLLSYIVMALLYKLFDTKKVWVISVLCAVAHNVGQIIAAVAITHVPEIIWYLPALIISAIITGALTGVVAMLILNNKNIRGYTE